MKYEVDISPGFRLFAWSDEINVVLDELEREIDAAHTAEELEAAKKRALDGIRECDKRWIE